MADTQQRFPDHSQPHLEPIEPAQPHRSPLTTSSLQQLRRDNDPERPSTPISPLMSRRTSFESDRFSTVSGLTSYFPNNPTNVRPPPEYVAPFGASQVVSEHLLAQRPPSSDEEGDEKLNKDEVQFTDPALGLVNAFLDQLLFSFLSTARSTSLLALRPAVAEVLKHRLGRDAITSAEEELSDLLAGGEDEDEEDQKHKTAEDSRKWDLELVWKRTRLRVMVYMRLGEMEDDDEQRYVKEEELFHGNERRFSQSSGLVSWAAAIFLTSVLEYIAEQTLQVAGQAAYSRARRQSRSMRLASPGKQQSSVGLTVEEYDVEKVALNAPLGRLWRTWRKALRNNAAPGTPTRTHRSSISFGQTIRDNMASAASQRRSSFGTANEGSVANESRPISRDQATDVTEVDYPEHVLAANIPLPIRSSTRDIDEIVVPGLARDPDSEDTPEPNIDEEHATDLLGSLVPLPISTEKRDVDEIEVPGLATDPDAPDVQQDVLEARSRRHSFSGFDSHHTLRGMPTTKTISADSATEGASPTAGRARSTSVPTQNRTPHPSDVLPPIANVIAPTHEVATQDAAEEAEEGHPHESTRGIPQERLVPAPEAAQPSLDENVKQKRRSEYPWMVGGAAVGAAGGAWAAAQSRKEQQGDTSAVEHDTAAADNKLDELGATSVGATDFESCHTTGDAIEEPVRRFSDQEIEDLDRRKSLVDIKALMFVNGPSNAASGEQSPRTEEPSSRAVAEDARDNETSERVSSEEGPEDAIGVATTSDVTNSAPRMEQARDGVVALEPESAAPQDRGVDSPTIEQSSPTNTQRQYIDLTADASKQEESGQLPTDNNGGAETDTARSTLPPRGSSLQGQSNGDGRSAKMNILNSVDGRAPKSPKSARLVSNAAALSVLTSSSIRGPEDFDSFVQGGDTVKYTLTPDTVRDMPFTASKPKQKSLVEMDAASASAKAERRAGRSPASKSATSAFATIGATDDEARYQSSKRRSISKPSPRNISTHRKSGLMAREPRVQTESTRDFADFIRSTGPGKDTTIHPLLSNASQTSLHDLRSAHIQGASASRSSSPSGERSKSFSQAPGTDSHVPPVPAIPARPKPNMQPRGAKVATNGSSDLIDFIRSGPAEEGTHRISRSVAPFRSTMDSDQLQDLTSARESAERSFDSRMTTSGASVQSPSMISSKRTSYNSRSALLNGAGYGAYAVQPTPSAQSQRPTNSYGTSSQSTAAQQNQPVRKRVRNKDPYSMDFLDDDDDDDEDDDMAPQEREGESLADFLNNNEPPRNNGPRPVVSVDSPEARSAAARVRASSGNGQQFVHNISGKTRLAQNGSRPQSGHTTPRDIPPLQSSAPAAAPKLQARGGAKDIAANSNTRELADFFKSSGPEEVESAPAPTVGRVYRPGAKDEKAKKKGFGGSFFGRSIRRKTYLDMP